MSKINSLDIAVAVLAAVSCLGVLIGLPIWALFIGWAWYFTLGATVSILRNAIFSMLMGSLLAVAAIVLIDGLSLVLPPLAAMMAAVLITVFLLMLSLKAAAFNCSLASFNAYSCMFAGYYAQAFPAQTGYISSLFFAVLWITGANLIGLGFGWLSIYLSGLRKSVNESIQQ